jgi:hypothetical protein
MEWMKYTPIEKKPDCFVGSAGIRRADPPPASPGEAGAGLAMTSINYPLAIRSSVNPSESGE